jgi:hypothetical protein
MSGKVGTGFPMRTCARSDLEAHPDPTGSGCAHRDRGHREHPGSARDVATGHIVVIIPTLNEEQSIADVVRRIPRPLIDRIIVADGGSRDATAAQARAAGADVMDAGRGYGRACLGAALAAEDAEMVVFMDGDGADDPRGSPDWSSRSAPAVTFRDRLASARQREPGSIAWHQLAAGRLAGLGMWLIYGVRYTDMRVAGDPARYAARARDARAHVWLEYRDADAGGPRWDAHSEIRSTIIAQRRRVEGCGKPVRNDPSWHAHHCDLRAGCVGGEGDSRATAGKPSIGR